MSRLPQIDPLRQIANDREAISKLTLLLGNLRLNEGTRLYVDNWEKLMDIYGELSVGG